jgi:hypothetical protein
VRHQCSAISNTRKQAILFQSFSQTKRRGEDQEIGA